MLLINHWMAQLNKLYDHNSSVLDEHCLHETFAVCVAVLVLVWKQIACGDD
jgi:hypothetical protein